MKVCTQCKARFTGEPERCPLDGAPLADLPDPMLGRTIGGRYRLVRKLGAGGMGTVYLARHDLLQRDVAIKILAPELAVDPVQKERFLREARASNRVKHPNIIDISDFGEESGLVYLVMELLRGESLSQHLASHRLSPREATELLIQIAGALARAHELEVVHRDIKSDNVFLCSTPHGGVQVKVLDFGLAHLHDEVRLTMSGAVFGTPEYMSPEQAQGLPCGPASDLYALGVVYFEMLTGSLPFTGSMAELIVKHLRSPAPSARAKVPSLPAAADAILGRLLEKDPQRRYRSAFHLIEDLEKLLESLPAGPGKAPGKAPGARSHVTGEGAEVPLSHPVPVQTWRERRNALRMAVALAYPAGTPPTWVRASLTDFEEQLEQAPELERALQTLAQELAASEKRVGETRERIGRALDELARDEDAAGRELEELGSEVAHADTVAGSARESLEALWHQATESVRERGLDPTSAERVDAAGSAAAAWRVALATLEGARRERAARQQAHEDLGFQIAQLKGRLAAVNAESEAEHGAIKTRVAALGARLAEAHGALEEIASALVKHLAEFPAARALVAPRHG